ncbi:hypothetical protein OpiT1DRAFT_04805 [Opitutaceae bacterium TAV1]|nr:hypothetical protein OpiT1DRAFT_04805 [Opitutaceae bacterium TAV1]
MTHFIGVLHKNPPVTVSLFQRPLFILLLAFVAGPATIVPGAPIDLQTLVDDSPFGKAPDPAATPTAQDPNALEFRGYVLDKGVRYFSLYDPGTQKSSWVNEKDAGPITIKEFNVDDDSLTVEQAGRTVRLALKRANIVNTPVPAAQAGLRPRGNRPPFGNDAAAGTARPQIDNERLQKIREEVAKRRAARQSAAGGGQAAPATTTPAAAN